MHSTTRFLAVPAGGLLLAAAVATPVLAHSDDGTTPPASTPGMARMHEQMMSGDNSGMVRMHEQMMSDDNVAAEPQSSATR